MEDKKNIAIKPIPGLAEHIEALYKWAMDDLSSKVGMPRMRAGKFSPFNGWTYPPSEAVRPSSSGEHYRGYLLYR